ncbi:hypothetical protein ENBRE01_3029 [Enteropsectra breve]|nr:hypothetical protein ENBRE01_3029 [Enteropsectra breve]
MLKKVKFWLILILALKKRNSAKIEQIKESYQQLSPVKKNYGISPWKGRPCTLFSGHKKAKAKYAGGKSVAANGIKAHFDVKASKDTILRVLKSDGGLKRCKYKRKPLLTDDHKAGRIAFCKFNMERGKN